MRTEHDMLGEMDIPLHLRYGIQTVRALHNFPISGVSIGQFPNLVKAFGIVKKAAATGNYAEGSLTKKQYDAICLACDDVISGALNDDFVVDVFQGGAGTSTNMNANEVIANRALEHLGLAHGSYEVIHPNEDVNRSQSTNDIYPTSVKLSMILSSQDLLNALEFLIASFEKKGVEFKNHVKLGRTQLQDAVPMTLGQEFNAFASIFKDDIAFLNEAIKGLSKVNLGGTAIGTCINASQAYIDVSFDSLRNFSGLDMRPASDMIAASWDMGAFITCSSVLKRIASKLSKVCNDLRLMSSGPRGGIGEIKLPAQQPGSSIMPGKVNPVIPESVNQVCFQVIGYDVAVTMAAEAGQYQLNAFEPLIAYNILTSMQLLSNASRNLVERCINGIEANVERSRQMAESCTTLATALVPVMGYDAAIRIAQSALISGVSVREAAIAEGLDPVLAADLLEPMRMANAH
ncbi:aspartate ammonia-lyase [Brucellaceae bacterium C25G]